MLKTTALLVCISVNNSSNPTNVIVQVYLYYTFHATSSLIVLLCCFAVAPYTLTYFAVKG